VLIAVDGSALDLVVCDRAHRLFGDDAEYVVVNVLEDPIVFATTPMGEGLSMTVTPAAWTAVDSEDVAERARHLADEAAERAGLPHAEPVGVVGRPADVIVRAAQEHEADVIVLGTHDRGWIDRWLDPSVSKAVTHASTVPVLLVRAPHPPTEVDPADAAGAEKED
jgi:nucleotide-binding universal stress UspA family protein